MDRITASEALYGFGGWLTTRPTNMVVGATANAAPMAEAVRDFIRVQEVADPRNGWQNYIAPMPDEAPDTSPEGLLNAWEAAKDALDAAKALEARLRTAAIAAIYPDGIDEGANTVELADGVKLTATGRINYTLDKDSDKVEKALDKLEKSGPEGKLIADRLVSWKPTLAVGEYKKLDDKFRKVIDTVLTTSEGTPSLALKRGK